jgi:DNA modification methylase
MRDLLGESEYFVHHGDCIEHMATLPGECFDFAVFSPPFPALYSYTSEACDIGNSEDLNGDAKIHLSFFYRQLARVVKPGRAIVVHVMQIPRMKRTGGEGLFDYRGLNIRLGERSGLVFEYDWTVRKNPQAQALRTRSRELQFAGLESDRAKSRGSLPDYLIKFRVPGVNAIPVDSEGEVSRNDWIEWAECTWNNMETRWMDNGLMRKATLNTEEGKGDKDTRHICPLQLGVIDRLVKLYSNPGEIVFSPFTGIGSEGFVSLKRNRRFYGCEIKDEYHAAALLNMERAIAERGCESKNLFSLLGS